METYYFEGLEDKNKVFFVALGKVSFLIVFDEVTKKAVKTTETKTYLKKEYVHNYSFYKLLNSSTAKERIEKSRLSEHLPPIQASISFETSLF